MTPYIDAVIISHFHLDHCGALPYMSEQVGYEGPIYMTLPTKVIAPILLEDFRKVLIGIHGPIGRNSLRFLNLICQCNFSRLLQNVTAKKPKPFSLLK